MRIEHVVLTKTSAYNLSALDNAEQRQRKVINNADDPVSNHSVLACQYRVRRLILIRIYTHTAYAIALD